MRAEFRPDVDLADAANDVREAVSRITPELPAGVEDLFVVKAEQDARPVMQLAVWSDRDPVDVLTRRVEDEIIPELTAVDGVAEVTVFGERERVIRVEVSPERLAAFGLSIGEVADALRAAQFDVPVGSFSAGELDVLVRADATVAEPRLHRGAGAARPRAPRRRGERLFRPGYAREHRAAERSPGAQPRHRPAGAVEHGANLRRRCGARSACSRSAFPICASR